MYIEAAHSLDGQAAHLQILDFPRGRFKLHNVIHLHDHNVFT